MKNFVTVLLGSLVLFSFTEKMHSQTTVIKFNYLSLVIKTINVGVEHAFSDATSLQVQGFYWLGGSVGDTKYNGFGITPEFRIYPSKTAPKGFFLAPYLRYKNYGISEETSSGTAEGTYSSMGGGLIFGGQFIFGDLITLEIFGGPGYNFGNLTWDTPITGSGNISGDGFTFRFGSTLGIAF